MRFDFADDVAVQWLPDIDHDVGIAELGRMTEALLALARFVQRAVGAHLATLPPGIVTGLPQPASALQQVAAEDLERNG